MPFIQVSLGAGRTDEQKRDLLLALSRAASEAISVSEASVRVWLVEVPATEIAAGGEILAERLAKSAGGTS